MEEKRAIALGFFDGVHIGHKTLIERAIKRSEEIGCTPAVISFDTHPDKMVKREKVELINNPYDRADIVSRIFGVEDMIYLHFDEQLMRMSWEQFIEWLVEDFGAEYLIAGYDFHFGYKGEGDPEKLKMKCASLGVGCDIMPRVTKDGVTVSSTLIRKLIKEGQMEESNALLGHPHTMTDRVRYGYRFGRKMGVPTVNMKFDEGILIPAHGVYATKTYLENGDEYMSITNIGMRPTVSGDRDISAETHLFGYSGNLYGKRVRIDFYKFLRPEKKYDNADALKASIFHDIGTTKEYFAELDKKAE